MRDKSRKPPACAGLDIGRHSIKLLWRPRRDGTTRTACLPLPPGAINDSAVADPFQVTETIKHALEQAGLQPGPCAIAVSGPAVATRILRVPHGLSDEETEGMVELEARRHVAFPRAGLSLDFAVLGPAEHDAGQSEVLLVAARSELVQARREAAEAAGMRVVAVTIEAVAMANALSQMCASQAGSPIQVCGVIDLGAGKTTLVVLRAGRLYYWREHPVSNEAGAGAEARVARALQAYAASAHDAPLEAVYLAGGGACDDELPARATRRHNVPCRLADPLSGLQDDHRSALPGMMLACGLALQAGAA